ncbi:nickel-dependent lactate racemase [Sediminispirochaeta bajacaliforniensis]|uniref:nickel-dependent lactate racemase n=1 Tax=Sediminispirochaeta bajacaliforniensis TaxID=148 RepID=UPI00036AF55E|nr:nickel-dependent lactate racemase [Sediminispirochaeta bajacaliforniensis]
MIIEFPYGKESLKLDVGEERLQGILLSKLHGYEAAMRQEELVENALRHPVGSPGLSSLADGKKKVVLIASDHTRPVPSKLMVPAMLRDIREGNPDAEITILIATGCHRGTTEDELISKFGSDIVRNEHICIHDCDDRLNMVKIGTLPSGGECFINRIAVEADLLVSEGFIEPHFFAGFSGARKSVLPGVASRETVLANHCSEFITHPKARTGILEGNPIHRDMVWAARKAGLAFILNVVINSRKEIIHAVAGDMEESHVQGCRFLDGLCRVEARPADIVISTNGGYPLDQNIYQAVKGMTAAEVTVRKGGVIIMVSRSEDGHGGEGFFHQMADEPDIYRTMDLFLSRGRNETVADQWQTQIFIRVLQKAHVIFVSQAPDRMVRALHMIPAHSLQEAMAEAEALIGRHHATVTAIPDGVSVIVVQ